jgi:hypothetical protein
MITKQRLLHDLRVVQKKIDTLQVHLDDPKRSRNFPVRNKLKFLIGERAGILAALDITSTEVTTQ